MKTDTKKIMMRIMVLLLCVCINFGGRSIGEWLQLPIWLDCVGTYMAAYFTGPIVTICVAVISQLIVAVNDSVAMCYTITSVVVALSLIYCKRKQYMNSLMQMVISSFWIGILCVIISTPLNIVLYDGYSGNIWGDALVDMLDWYGYPIALCAMGGEIIVEIVDKQICIVLAYGLIRMVEHWRSNRRKVQETKAISLLVIAATLLSLALPGTRVSAQEADAWKNNNYMSVIYNNTSGMMSSEANVIAQTEDGCIWIGSYAGLTKYNGREFEFIREGGIVNVTAMFCDSKGRLWVGTNDGGIARYENGKFSFFTVENGLPVNSIRSFAEDENGNVYVGTTDCICIFDANDTISFLREEVKYITSMVADGEVLAVIDNNGNLYVLKGEEQIAEFRATDTGVFCQCVKRTTKGILVGTDHSVLYLLDTERTSLKPTNFQVLDEVCGIEEDEEGHIWICAESGFGYVDETGRFVEIVEEEFNASFESVMEDYQGNIWLTSSRYGVLKLSESRFADLFKNAGVESTVVNAVTEYQGKYYCGTDSGLLILQKDGTQLRDELTEVLEGDRIRCLTVDSKNCLWISTYGKNGLVCVDTSGKMQTFTMASTNTTSDRFRCTIELQDGTIVAGTADGINFIKNNKVVDTITVQEDKLANSQILSLAEHTDGTLYAGSDGGGIYVIQEGVVVDTYTVEDGLSSNVILRMVAYGEGYFVVTSNSLCYMENGQIREIKNFPYFNNYDVIIRGEEAYVLSSAGIYVAEAAQIVSDELFSYELLGTEEGLIAGLTANAWNYVDEEGRLFLCSNSGVILCDKMQGAVNQEVKFGIVSVDCDGEEITANNKIYQLPLQAKKITLRPSVQNYALQDVKVKFYVEGMEGDADAVSYQELEPIQISNLTHGTYKVHFLILDHTGNHVLQRKTYSLEKEMQLWEQPWYKLYLVSVAIELIVFATWTVINMINMSKRKNELEKISKELEQRVTSQVQQIREQEEKEVQMFRKMIIALSDTVDAKDRYTSGHSRRVAHYSKMIAARMGKSEKEQEDIYYAGLLHDVGKIRVPEAVINKPGKLTDEEFELIKIHPVTGYRILKNVAEDSQIALGAKFHHERYDGKGYPNGLSGTNIPEIARILGVADSYDAMASNRSYRNALPQEVVRSEIEKGKGTQFDPEIAAIMLELIDEDTDYAMKEGNTMNKTILVVDDEPMNIQVIQFIMKEDTMCQVIGAESGEAALQFIDEKNADLILLDIEMPRMNGFETFKAIREKSNVPVVFMTSDKEIDTIQKAAQLGVDDYLTKPFLPAALKEIIHSVMRFSE